MQKLISDTEELNNSPRVTQHIRTYSLLAFCLCDPTMNFVCHSSRHDPFLASTRTGLDVEVSGAKMNTYIFSDHLSVIRTRKVKSVLR